MTPEQLAYAQVGAGRIVRNQTDRIPFDNANSGYARYYFRLQIENPEWRQLIELATVLPSLESIWETDAFHCTGTKRRLFSLLCPDPEASQRHRRCVEGRDGRNNDLGLAIPLNRRQF